MVVLLLNKIRMELPGNTLLIDVMLLQYGNVTSVDNAVHSPSAEPHEYVSTSEVGLASSGLATVMLFPEGLNYEGAVSIRWC